MIVGYNGHLNFNSSCDYARHFKAGRFFVHRAMRFEASSSESGLLAAGFGSQPNTQAKACTLNCMSAKPQFALFSSAGEREGRCILQADRSFHLIVFHFGRNVCFHRMTGNVK